jgi:CheY-like chemotaxis protein
VAVGGEQGLSAPRQRHRSVSVSGVATVLIVEDEFAIADLLEMALTDEGYRVLLAANGRQGLQRLAEGPRPDLVISDYMMPILDGTGLLQAMAGNRGAARHPLHCHQLDAGGERARAHQRLRRVRA